MSGKAPLMAVTAGSPRRSASKLVCVCAAGLFANPGSMGVARIFDCSGLTGMLRLVDDASGMVEDRSTVEDRSPPEDGNFELAQAAIIPIASIKQPISKIFDIFTAFI